MGLKDEIYLGKGYQERWFHRDRVTALHHVPREAAESPPLEIAPSWASLSNFEVSRGVSRAGSRDLQGSSPA